MAPRWRRQPARRSAGRAQRVPRRGRGPGHEHRAGRRSSPRSASASTPTLSDGSLLPAVAIYLGIINVILAVFNLLPGAPLDGGRVLTAALWAWRKDRRAAEIAASRCGFVLGILLVGFGLLGFVTGNGFGDIWTALIGWFVHRRVAYPKS